MSTTEAAQSQGAQPDTAHTEATQIDATLAPKIVKQIDYYFSDSNLPRDKFLQEAIKKTEGGWVSFETLLTFKRLAQLTTDAGVIAAALADSLLVDVSEDKKSVRRSPNHPLPDEVVGNARSIYAKGFPVDKAEFEPIEQFFVGKGYKILSVRLRRHLTTKAFKGSAFVEFDTEDAAKKAAAEAHEYEGSALIVKMKDDYLKSKRDERAETKKEKSKASSKTKASEDKEDEKEEEELKFEPACVLHLSGLSATASREDIKEKLSTFGEVAWVDFSRGETEAHVRFAVTGDAAKAVTSLTENKTEIAGSVPTIKLLEGQDELTYQLKLAQEKRDRFSSKSRGGKRGGSRGGRGGRGGSRGGRGGSKRKAEGDRSGKRSRDD